MRMVFSVGKQELNKTLQGCEAWPVSGKVPGKMLDNVPVVTWGMAVSPRSALAVPSQYLHGRVAGMKADPRTDMTAFLWAFCLMWTS